jgi:uncharacterized LabA/DUF88 family protein
MDRVAIFVDAGYLFAAGSAALIGSKQPRNLLTLNESAAIAELMAIADAATNKAAILRVYWYDAMIPGKGPTADQALLANTNNVKLRLGFLNSQGQQKGVDSLIVTDLIDLARNRAIADAVLLSGDEDIRIGVQVAQSYGVRVHLLGIAPSRGSQSRQLMQEVDTTAEWDKNVVARFLSLRPATTGLGVAGLRVNVTPATLRTPEATAAPRPVTSSQAARPLVEDARLDQVVAGIVATLNNADVIGLQAYGGTQRGVPPEFDVKLLTQGRGLLQRDLTESEKRYLRTKFMTAAKAAAGGRSPDKP